MGYYVMAEINPARKDLLPDVRVVLLLSALMILSTYSYAQSNGMAKSDALSPHVISVFGTPPDIPTGDLSPDVKAAVDIVFKDSLANGGWGKSQAAALDVIAQSNDPRLAWPIADLMRFISQQALMADLGGATQTLLDIEIKDGRYWGSTTDHLMAWNIPAPPDYLDYKKGIFTTLIPGWENIFREGNIDWRHVSWGGVLIDDRPYDTTDEPCNCIPAADNPTVTQAKDATWPKDNDIVFGIQVNGEYRAYPRQIMEVREMVNDTLGGRTLGIPYCTLCGSAQAYFTDALPEGVMRPVLRTSGLLIRSNKVMYDINSYSVFDTFTGQAVTGSLAQKNIKLEQATVVTTTWGEWKSAYPETTVLEERLALGKNFDFKNNRDANGPIFPVGDVDPRLDVHADVVGVVTDAGKAIAFDRRKAMLELQQGETVEQDGIELILDAGGIKAVSESAENISSHEAFWFAWSQFHPDTVLWPN